METLGRMQAQNAEEDAAIRALKRAYKEECHGKFFQFGEINGERVGWYRVDSRLYAVNTERCECKGAQAGLMCKHRAAYADLTGELERLIPNAYARIFAPETKVCPECHGDGYGRMYVGGHFSDWIACDCHACGNTGRVPVAAAEPLSAA